MTPSHRIGSGPAEPGKSVLAANGVRGRPRPAATEDLMTYATSRDDAFSTRIEAAIEDFASQYELNAYSSVPKRTIFLFPGGLGSELMRSFQAYPGAALSFEKVWLDAGIWDDDIPHLKMLIGG